MHELFLLRHAETTANATGTLQGRLDFPLSERGAAQAQALGPTLAGLGCGLVLRSPSARVWRTLEPAIALGLPRPHVIDDLDELDLGDAAGLSFAEFLTRYGSTIDEQAYDRGEYRFPGGESRRDLYRRAQAAWAQISKLADFDGAEPPLSVLVAGHGGLLSQLIAVVLATPNDGRIRFRLDNGALAKICWHRRQPFLSRLNASDHLPASIRSPTFAPNLLGRPR
jgi:broad specificity phosphatase PhoE